MKVRLTQLDGKLPNLALMKLAHYFRHQGAEVTLTKAARRDLFEPEYDLVLGSQIFNLSTRKAEVFMSNFPKAIVRGTGTNSVETVEQFLGVDNYEYFDYSDHPDFHPSIGFSQRGCRKRCPFCVVPAKEGKVKSNATIREIWRGDDHPKQIILLDNDFFGNPHWRERASEIIEGNFEVNFNQGINARLIDREGAEHLAQMKYRDAEFKRKRIYTAWDNRKDEAVFIKGVQHLLDAGIKPSHIMVYMLCGYWRGETIDDLLYRFNKMNAIGLTPYPMVYDPSNKMIKKFQRWIVRRYYQFIDWDTFNNSTEQDYYAKNDSSPRLFV